MAEAIVMLDHFPHARGGEPLELYLPQTKILFSQHAGTIPRVERNEARPHGEDCAEAQAQRTVPVELNFAIYRGIILAATSAPGRVDHG